MNDDDVMQLFQPLYNDLRPEAAFHVKKPLLAHYTTIQVLEKILMTNEIWFSNPLFMNDLEEVRFGILEGSKVAMESEEIAKACKTAERARHFRHWFGHYFGEFDTRHLVNTYVFCMSQHGNDDNDGLLSMWRGYGANGNGVAIVIDTAQLDLIDKSPLIVGSVSYGRAEFRRTWLNSLVTTFAGILSSSDIHTEKLYLAAYSLFERIKLFALFSKHHGFKEEEEWRVVYMPDRDRDKKLEPMFDYAIGPRGIEPKLKFKIAPVEGVTPADMSLTKITERIIMGPTITSPLANAAVRRMFDLLKRSDLSPKLRASTIPFRSIA